MHSCCNLYEVPPGDLRSGDRLAGVWLVVETERFEQELPLGTADFLMQKTFGNMSVAESDEVPTGPLHQQGHYCCRSAGLTTRDGLFLQPCVHRCRNLYEIPAARGL